MKTYSEFVAESKRSEPCSGGCTDTTIQEENLNEGFGDWLSALLGRSADKQLGKMSKALDKAREKFKIAVDVTRKVERGDIKLKNDRDESNFRNVALESGIYTNDGKGTARGEKGISKHIDIVIARNKATQIKDSHIQRSIDTFLNKVSSDDFCGNYG
tara:strand:+ start:8448 stop:8921 length:474 start_codon:yes stop_codon:yes gene_type:complete